MVISMCLKDAPAKELVSIALFFRKVGRRMDRSIDGRTERERERERGYLNRFRR